MTSSTTTDALADSLGPTEVAAYLARLGVVAPEAPTLGALASLHRAHLVQVPFENLDIVLGRPIRLDLDSLHTKIVGRRRGGYCYELGGLFGALLRSLGYAVDLVSARVSTADGGLTDDFDHLALVVTSPDLPGPVLADVGFGDAFIEPLPLRDGVEVHEAGKDVGLVQVGDTWHYRERRHGRAATRTPIVPTVPAARRSRTAARPGTAAGHGTAASITTTVHGRRSTSSRRHRTSSPTSSHATAGSRPHRRATSPASGSPHG